MGQTCVLHRLSIFGYAAMLSLGKWVSLGGGRGKRKEM